MWIRRRAPSARLGPCDDISRRVNHAPANLPVARAGAVQAVLLERATGEAEQLGRFLGSEIGRERLGLEGFHEAVRHGGGGS